MSIDPITRFQAVFARARERSGAHEDPTAFTLATADPETGRPSSRVVLLKEVDERGFVFYTNYQSRKGRELAANPRASLCFYWPTLSEQVRVEGEVEKLPAGESDTYFASRDRNSRVGAWASEQSRILPSRFTLLRRFVRLQAKFAGGPVPRPPHWGGYLVRPHRIEFWIGRGSRLHDRWLYERDGDGWTRRMLYP